MFTRRTEGSGSGDTCGWGQLHVDIYQKIGTTDVILSSRRKKLAFLPVGKNEKWKFDHSCKLRNWRYKELKTKI